MSIARDFLLIPIMSSTPRRPAGSTAATVKSDYAPYAQPLPADAARLLEHVAIGGVTAIYYECSPLYKMPPRRIGDDMFYFLAKGRGEIQVDDRVTEVQAGDCAHFRRGVLHGAVTDSQNPFDIIAVHYNATVFESLTLPQVLDFPDSFPLGTASPAAEMLGIMCREYSLRPLGWERGLEALMFRLLLFLLREHGEKMDWQTRSTRWRELQRVLPALEKMRKNLHAPLSVDELARECHLSAPQFRRVFRQALQSPPLEYLRRLRMEEAALLLRRTNATIEDVAERVGYADPSFFAHSFKAMMGLPPGKYRAMSSV